MSRHRGSGLGLEGICGSWKVWQIWDRRNKPLPLSGRTLRALDGTLEIQSTGEGQLALVNSVTCGLLRVCFTGPGELKLKRPLLVFHFNTIQLRLAGRPIVSGRLPAPPERKEPFFALIATGNTTSGLTWLAARGRGGGLALWLRADRDAS